MIRRAYPCRRLLLLAAVLLASALSLTATQSEGNTLQATVDSKPNILFVMTDDMPKDLLNRMPHVSDRIAAQGLTLDNAYVSQSLCCPSRATFLRGQYPHNTGILNNEPPNGGWQDFKGFGLEADTVARWVQAAGYTTEYIAS